MPDSAQQVATIVVQSLYNAGIRTVFGIPGAKIDAVFDTLLDHPEIRLIVCRHEQNAALMAQATGRITGVPGVCIATSGPGASNLATGLVTATTEGDPVVAIIGSVPRLMNTHRTHQSMKALDVLGPTCKAAIAIDVEDQTAEVVLTAFRQASTLPRGAAVISLPSDIAKGTSKYPAFPTSAFTPPLHGAASSESVAKAADLIAAAKLPVIFLGLRASSPPIVAVVRAFLEKYQIPTIETFQAAGAVSKELVHLFYGRVGLFRNQTGDKLLAKSDLVLAVGYDPVEYDTSAWNPEGKQRIINIDAQPCDYGVNYQPILELPGSISRTLGALSAALAAKTLPDLTNSPFLRNLSKEYASWQTSTDVKRTTGLIHPLHFLSALQSRVSKDTTVCVDVGTVYIYTMRYFFAYEPRRLLCSDGQQTLGVGLPWAIAASLAQEKPCSEKVISMSGDGGFMFSSNELVTAVKQGCNITHFIWNDSSYNMVEFQEEMKYGRSSGVALGGIDFVKFAEAFGAKGFRISDSSEVEQVMEQALAYEGVSIVDVKIDYGDVAGLAGDLIADQAD